MVHGSRFTRAWILQEVVLAQSTTFLLGQYEVTEQALLKSLDQVLPMAAELTPIIESDMSWGNQEFTLSSLKSIKIMFEARKNYDLRERKMPIEDSLHSAEKERSLTRETRFSRS
jgi:hypothetical protein